MQFFCAVAETETGNELELVLALQTPVAAPYGIDNLPSFPMRLEQ